MLNTIQTIEAHRGKGWAVAWNHLGDKLISVGEDKTAQIWSVNPTFLKEYKSQNASSGVSQEVLKFWKKFAEDNHQRSIRDVAWSPCGKYIVLASFDAQVTLWEIRSNGNLECLSVVEGHENEVKSVAWSPSGRYFSSCGRDKNVMIWTMIADGEDVDVECAGVMTSHTQDVKRVRWHPNEDILASASYDDTIQMYVHDDNDGDWSTIASLTGHTSTVWSLDFDVTGNRLASCSDDKTIKIWQKSGDKWNCISTIGGYHTRPIYGISWNKKNGLIATACGDNNIRIFKEIPGVNELEKNIFEMVFSIKAHDADVNNVEWNPVMSDILASIADDGNVKIWRWKDEL